MDSHHASIVGNANAEDGSFSPVAKVETEDAINNPSEKNGNNRERSIQLKFFKEIASHMQNATHIHITGTGQAQEQFMHFLKDTPQFKNAVTSESTANKMSDEKLVEFIAGKY